MIRHLKPTLREKRSASIRKLLALGLFAALPLAPARAAIFGTLSNFDIYNTTPEPAEGAEIELEGIHSTDIGGDFPCHFAIRNINDYTDNLGNFVGTRIRYENYNFPNAPVPGSLMPNPNPVSTNGHALTYTDGGEHFGFWINSGIQPTAQRFFWLNHNLLNNQYERIGTIPETVPGPTWSYVPPPPPADPMLPPPPPILHIEVKPPEPVEIQAQKPDSVWMKVYKLEMHQVPDDPMALLVQLMSGNAAVPEDTAELETEWELLEGGKMKAAEDNLADGTEAIIRRYEFFEYTGEYDDSHDPLSAFLEDSNLDPIALGEVGIFLSANMVGALLVAPGAAVPEPASAALLTAAGFGLMSLKSSRRSRLSF